MSMFRPWRQDDRPAWWATVEHEVSAALCDLERDAVKKQALATGLARHALVTQVEGRVSVYVLVKADSAEEATHAAGRIVEAAHREAGHGLLVRRMRLAARPQQAGPPRGQSPA